MSPNVDDPRLCLCVILWDKSRDGLYTDTCMAMFILKQRHESTEKSYNKHFGFQYIKIYQYDSYLNKN